MAAAIAVARVAVDELSVFSCAPPGMYTALSATPTSAA